MSHVNPGAYDSTLARLYGDILTSPTMDRMARDLLLRIGPRPAGTTAGGAAQAFARKAMEEAGCDAVRMEPFPLTVWERGTLRLETVRPVPRKLQALSLGLSPGTGASALYGEVRDRGYGLASDYELDVKEPSLTGSFVLVEEGAPPGVPAPHRAVKTRLAEEAGAAALLLVSGEPGGLPRTGTCTFTGEASRIPAVGLAREDGLFLRRLVQDQGVPVECRLSMENRLGKGEARNVIGVLRGREQPEEYLYLGAHLDSWDISEGALDNGTGVLVVLETARALARLSTRARRSIVFCLFMGEETGLLGSFHHARSLGKGVENLVALLNLDIVGRPRGLAAGGKRAAFPFLHEAGTVLSPLGIEEELITTPGLHSDHVPFMLQGVPTLSWQCAFPERTLMYCHSSADTMDKIDLPGLRLCACATAALIFLLAEVPERPARPLSPKETRTMLEDAGLRASLEAEGAWPF